MQDNTAKKAIAAGEIVGGIMVQEFATSGIAAIAAAAGAQFAVYDLEHTGWSLETLKMLVATGRGTGLIPLARVPGIDPHYISHAMDVGVCGLVIPNVPDAEALERAVQAAYYPPIGLRGCSFGLIHDDYKAADLPAMMAHANDNLLFIAQIESVAAVEAADAICSHPHVHAIWIGHFDLSCSLGKPGDFTTAEYKQCITKITAACQQANKPMVLGTGDPKALANGSSQGFQILVYTSDIGIFTNAVRQCMDSING